MPAKPIQLKELTAAAFAPYGDVIETRNAEAFPINNGSTTRFHDLAKVETAGRGARTLINLFRGKPFELPITIAMLERHPLGSQAFIPLHGRPWLVVVARDEFGSPAEPKAFLVRPGADGFRGVNYARNVWHHPLLSLEAEGDFCVVDRGGEENNLEEFFFDRPYEITSLDAG